MLVSSFVIVEASEKLERRCFFLIVAKMNIIIPLQTMMRIIETCSSQSDSTKIVYKDAINLLFSSPMKVGQFRATKSQTNLNLRPNSKYTKLKAMRNIKLEMLKCSKEAVIEESMRKTDFPTQKSKSKQEKEEMLQRQRNKKYLLTMGSTFFNITNDKTVNCSNEYYYDNEKVSKNNNKVEDKHTRNHLCEGTVKSFRDKKYLRSHIQRHDLATNPVQTSLKEQELYYFIYCLGLRLYIS